jgi:hypothetical protein
MRYLQRAIDLAEARGYLRYPKVLARQQQAPDWFRALASDSGVAAFETRHGFRIPVALRELYGSPPLASFLEEPIDAEVFLTDLAKLTGTDMPPIVTWSAEPHLVFAFHNHSGMVCAVPVGGDDPYVLCGIDGDPDPYTEEGRPPVRFSEWVFGAVDGYEAQLEYWQGVYEKCKADPAEARRLGGVEWIRGIPGMAPRLDRV